MASILFKELTFPCQYLEYGCHDDFMERDLIWHEENGRFLKPVEYFYYECKEIVAYDRFLDHVKEEHPSVWSRNYGETKNLKLKMMDHVYQHFTAFNRKFLKVCVVEDDYCFIWMYLAGYPEEAKNFVFHVSLKNDSDEEMTYTGHVRSIFETKRTIIDNGDAFYISEKELKKFPEIHFTVRNLKEEAKDDDEESGISN